LNSSLVSNENVKPEQDWLSLPEKKGCCQSIVWSHFPGS